MLVDGEGPFDLRWVKGGPGEEGAIVQYGLKRDGMYNVIQEEITEIKSNKEIDVHRISWKNVKSDPWLPLQGYNSHFEIQPAEIDLSVESSSLLEEVPGPLCRLVWTQTFSKPRIFGI